jgi:hypothetical protein
MRRRAAQRGISCRTDRPGHRITTARRVEVSSWIDIEKRNFLLGTAISILIINVNNMNFQRHRKLPEGKAVGDGCSIPSSARIALFFSNNLLWLPFLRFFLGTKE